MKSPFDIFLLLLLGAAAGLSSCKKDADPTSSLVGTWQLRSRQCECAAGPVPDETVTFTATGFFLYRNGQFVGDGTYRDTTVRLCSSVPIPALHFRYTSLRLPSFNASATIQALGTTLVLDHGGECDALLDTYTRQR